MASRANLPESQLKALLDSLGLTGAFSVDADGLDAPKVQIGYFDDSADGLLDTERFISILKVGDNNPGEGELLRDLNMLIIFTGISMSDAAIVNARMQDFVRELRGQSLDCISATWPSEPNGPYPLESGRVSYELPIRVVFGGDKS